MAMKEEERKNTNCNHCSKGIYRYPSKLKRNKVCYCSPECHNLAQRAGITEEERKERIRQTKLKYAHSARGIAKNKELYLKKRPELLEYKKEWAKKNEDHCRELARKYYGDNKDAISAKAKVYYQINKAVINEKQRKYYAKNPERSRQVSKKWYSENKQRAYLTNRKWATNNKERVRDMARKMRGELHDCYIKGLFTRKTLLTAKDIPQSLIEAKRLEIQMKRFIKEQENG
jgi:hypothetical protein